MPKRQAVITRELKQKLNETKERNRELSLKLQNEKTKNQRMHEIIESAKKYAGKLESLWDPTVLKRGGAPWFMHAQNNLEFMIRDDFALTRTISISKERFDDICARVAGASVGDDLLFYEDGSPLPGNRCRLSRNQAVYVSILLKKADPRQVDLGAWLGIHQSTVSRVVAYIDSILVRVLPTADVIRLRIKHAGLAKLDQFMPDNELMADGTEIPIERPQDDEVQKRYYSGKKKRHTVKSTIVTNRDGLIIYAGPPHEGRTHDMEMLRLDDPDLGIVTRRMKSARTPDAKKVVSWSDLGYAGIDGLYPGIMSMQPIKKPRKKKGQKRKGLARDEKRYNKKISRIRIGVEHAIGKLKHFAVLRNVYVGSDESLRRDLQIVSGLVNHRMLWNEEEKRLDLGL